MLVRREKVSLADGTWRPGLVVGCLFALEFLLLGEGLRHTSAGHAVVFLYTAPIFAALGLHWKLPAEKLEPMQWVGIASAFTGIAVTFLGRGLGTSTGGAATALLGDLLCFAGGAAWGATLVCAFVLLLAAAAMLGQLSFNPTPMAWGSLVFQSVIVSFVSLLVWFGLLRRYLASRLGVFSFMTPLFGIVLGAWMLDEQVEPRFLVGAALVLAGIVLVSGYGWWKQAVHTLKGNC